MSLGTPVIILGIHRSRTSSLAGSLKAAGMSLDEVNTRATHNAKGNREHQRIMQLHERVFANTGHAWNHLPPREAEWQAPDRGERDANIAALDTRPCAAPAMFREA